MNRKNFGGLGLLVILLAAAGLACGSLGDDDGPPRNSNVIAVAANPSLNSWLQQAAADFNEMEVEGDNGRQYFVDVTAVESGLAITQMADGSLAPALWLPDDRVWANLLADQGDDAFQNDCTSVAESPLVIGIWRQVAESLGWPGLPLGWLDMGSLAADPSAWRYYSGGEYGNALRLGHTHPGLSATGANTLLAIVQSAQAKTDAVTVEDVSQPIVQASVGAFESAVAWFSANTDDLGATMRERGVDYLGAAVMYESTIVEHGGGEIIPVYPLEGTYVARHPACLNGAADEIAQAGARAFRTFLLSDESQQQALAVGLRPASADVELGAPLLAANGIDTTQPATVFASPSVETVYAVQELWQQARKDVNLVMLLDTSGSMRGRKIENMRDAAVQFVRQMGDDDFMTLIAFSNRPELVIFHAGLAENRRGLEDVIQSLEAQGDTTLFDAIGDGAEVIASTTSVETANAMVVLTDGQDTASFRYSYGDELLAAAAANDTTVFTIAYGGDADEDILQEIATGANGNFYLGDEASIAAIYEEMSAAFGGAVGVGR